MSQENVDLLQRWRESWNRQDAEATAACLHEDVVVDFSDALGPFRGVYQGPAEAVGFMTTMWEAWDQATIEFAEVIDCGSGRMITVNAFHTQGRSSGVRTEARVANLWSFRDGLIHRSKLFQSKDEALEAVGLSE
jgi:ketosteroid isomerase-like protein